jgi:hypothetical protein
MSRIDLKIDRVVLRGVDPADRHALVNGLRSELARILADPAARAAWARSRRMPVLRVGTMTWEPGRAGARRLGGGIARAIGRKIAP